MKQLEPEVLDKRVKDIVLQFKKKYAGIVNQIRSIHKQEDIPNELMQYRNYVPLLDTLNSFQVIYQELNTRDLRKFNRELLSLSVKGTKLVEKYRSSLFSRREFLRNTGNSKNIIENTILTENIQVDRPIVNQFFLFDYESVNPKGVYYYDKYPLIYCTPKENPNVSFRGINLHYIAPNLRIELIKHALFDKKDVYKQEIIATKGLSSKFEPLINNYNIDGVQSAFKLILPIDWLLIAAMGIENFVTTKSLVERKQLPPEVVWQLSKLILVDSTHRYRINSTAFKTINKRLIENAEYTGKVTRSLKYGKG